MNKYLAVLTATAFLGTGCKTSYQKGFDSGYSGTYSTGHSETYNSGLSSGEAAGRVDGQAAGYSDGHTQGYAQGFDHAFDLYASADYQLGFGAGSTAGYNLGYNEGESLGAYQGSIDGYQNGLDDSYVDNYNNGYSIGSADGNNDGYTNGYADYFSSSYSSGYSVGSTNGYNEGYDIGWNDGYNDGLGNSVSKNPAIALASQVNSDLVDYAALPKFDKTQALTSMALNHADGGSVDLEKLAALKEQFYLGAIKNQLSAKFGLSTASATKIANIVHQFNKAAGSRELTTEDASAFSQNLVGFDMNSIENAVRKSAKGESSDLTKLVEKAAGNLDMSPESFNNMITTIFF